jgi:hypothetical protein
MSLSSAGMILHSAVAPRVGKLSLTASFEK